MRKVKLLLIEGDAGIADAVGRVLRCRFGEGAVVVADSLAPALDMRLESFDLVLTEWQLPDGRGHAVLDGLRAGGAEGIIVVTEANVGAVAVEAVLAGATDYVVRQGDYLVTLPLVVEKNLTVARLRRDQAVLTRQLQDQNETLNELLKSLAEAAATDPLTNLYNRRHFASVLEQMFEDARRSGSDLACVMLDMDGFKQLNDGFGHQAGDAALILAAGEIRACLRKMDAAARYGGDEFVALLPRTDALEAAGVARRIRESYHSEMRARGYSSLPVGISFGVASVSGDGPATGDALVAAADAALYRAKRMGRDRVYVSGVPSGLPAALAG